MKLSRTDIKKEHYRTEVVHASTNVWTQAQPSCKLRFIYELFALLRIEWQKAIYTHSGSFYTQLKAGILDPDLVITGSFKTRKKFYTCWLRSNRRKVQLETYSLRFLNVYVHLLYFPQNDNELAICMVKLSSEAIVYDLWKMFFLTKYFDSYLMNGKRSDRKYSTEKPRKSIHKLWLGY